MIRDIVNWFQAQLVQEQEAPVEHGLHLALAALLMEVSRADHDKDSTERRAILDILNEQFEFSAEELDNLLQIADDATEESHDLYSFTSIVNKHYNYDQKLMVIRLLWQVAYADGTLEAIEDHMIRRIAGLLHVDHQDFVQARITVKQALGH